MKFRFILLVCALAFAVTLAVVVGQRLSTEAMAVVVGVVAGVAASIPTALIVVWIASRAPAPAARSEPQATPAPRREPETKIIVVPASAAAYSPPPPYLSLDTPGPAYQAPAPPRNFRVIGGEDMLDHDGE